MADDTALATSREPHCLQKLASEGFSAPHFVHRLANEPPQPTQNFASSGLSRVQLEQRIATSGQLVEQRFGVFQVGSVETLGEPIVDFGEYPTRFVAAVGIAQQASEPRRRTYFP